MLYAYSIQCQANTNPEYLGVTQNDLIHAITKSHADYPIKYINLNRSTKTKSARNIYAIQLTSQTASSSHATH